MPPFPALSFYREQSSSKFQSKRRRRRGGIGKWRFSLEEEEESIHLRQTSLSLSLSLSLSVESDSRCDLLRQVRQTRLLVLLSSGLASLTLEAKVSMCIQERKVI